MLVFILTLMNSCKKAGTDNNPAIPGMLPVQPGGLKAVLVNNSQVQLTWVDSSSNETGFVIERRATTGTFTAIKTLVANSTSYLDTGMAVNASYNYRIFAFNGFGNSTGYSNIATIFVPNPVLINTVINPGITASELTTGSNILSDGGYPVMARGVTWSIAAHPTVTVSTKTFDSSGTGIFISHLTGLTANTIYFVRAYAINSKGTYYGNEIQFITAPPNLIDIDGTSYPLVRIGSQVWMQQNLNVGRFSNGDPIPVVTDPAAWSALTLGARCFYYNDSANYTHEWGSLYNWNAVNDPRGLAPAGWHIPSDDEWTVLVNFLGGPDSAGGKMKSRSSHYWLPPNTGATNSSEFNAIPAGLRDNNGGFASYGTDGGFFWAATPFSTTNAWLRYVVYDAAWCMKGTVGGDKHYGLSVRCLKN